MIIGLYKSLKQQEELEELNPIARHECGICCEAIDESELVTLSCCDNKCGCPYYHHQCILSWWTNIHKKAYLIKKTYVIRQCPYCRVSVDLIKPPIGIIKLHSEIHLGFTEYINNKLYCLAITRKGTKCCNKKKHGNFCGIHKKKNIIQT